VTDDVKVLVDVMRANERRRGLAPLSMSVLDGFEWSASRSARFKPWEVTPLPID